MKLKNLFEQLRTYPLKAKLFYNMIISGLKHPSVKIKTISITFITCCFTILINAIYFVFILINKPKNQNPNHAAFIKHQDEEQRLRSQKMSAALKRHLSEINLGKFHIAIQSNEQSQFEIKNMGQIEITLLCNNEDLRNWIDQHKAIMQDQIYKILDIVTREDLMTAEGKKRLKNTLIKQLNEFLPFGIIHDIYFSNLVIT
jgi:flagellar basal body-associated protein FliL